MNSDSKVMMMALQREREELHEKLMQVDRIIKKIRNGSFDEPQSAHVITIEQAQLPVVQTPTFTIDTHIKVQILRVFDIIGKAVSLSVVQKEYGKLSGNNYIIRDVVRSLQKSKLLRLCRDKSSSRGHLWIKAEWLENGQIMDNHKPDGFDLLYKAENLLFE